MYRCNFCGKTYSRESFYLRHELLCDMKQIVKHKNTNVNQQINFTPSETTALIQRLMQRIDSLEEEVSCMRKWVNKNKEKCNIYDWLRKNCFTECNSYLDNITSYRCSEADFNYFNKQDIYEGIFMIFKKMFPLEEYEHFPIKCFQQKPNVFYVFHEGKWIQQTQQNFDNMIIAVHRKLMAYFKNLEKDNKMLSNERSQEIYLKIMIKLLNYDFEDCRKRVTKKMFSYFGYDLKNVIEYDFVF